MVIKVGDRWAIKYNTRSRDQPWQVIDYQKVRKVKSGVRVGDIACNGVVASMPSFIEAVTVLERHATFAQAKAGADPLAAVRGTCALLQQLLGKLAEAEQRADLRQVALIIDEVTGAQ